MFFFSFLTTRRSMQIEFGKAWDFFFFFVKIRKNKTKAGQPSSSWPRPSGLDWKKKTKNLRPLIPFSLSGRGRERKRGQGLLGCLGSEKKQKQSKFERSMRAQGKRSRLHRSRSRKVMRSHARWKKIKTIKKIILMREKKNREREGNQHLFGK